MSAQRFIARRKGFTLVEILIVVIILGILAAIVIPQFTNASEDARKSSLTSQLQTIRSQVELYKLQHRDQFPTSTGTPAGVWDWEKMTTRTNEDGAEYEAGDVGPFGPYLQGPPKNPLTGKSDMQAVATEVEMGATHTFNNNGWLITP
ncbi:MAG TPA: prepilin-type N-terminal cleavage/methylation domain-containing protein, partial [Tepidisphaeraceae bacterium]